MSHRIRFGEVEADVTTGELRRGGTLVPIRDLPFRLLAALLERPGELVRRGELAALGIGDLHVDVFRHGCNDAVRPRPAQSTGAEFPVNCR